MALNPLIKKRITSIAIIGGLALLAWWGWSSLATDPYAGLVSGNGRIEATEIDIASRLGGRVEEIRVKEGDFVTASQPLAKMQTDVLQAQRDEAEAHRREAEYMAVAAEAQVAQREAELDAAQRRMARSKTLSREGGVSVQELDDDRARMQSAEAALKAVKAQSVGANATVNAAKATVARIDADIRDSELKSPRDGRVQFLITQPGEVIGAGGRVLNLVDLADVYMTFFLPETVVGRVALGSEARIVLDAAPESPIPARVSFVASTAQFTPKTVETASERQKLMFRVKAQISPTLLRQHQNQVKIGLPGVVWVKLDDSTPWPKNLSTHLAE